MAFLEGFLPDLTQKMFLISDMQDVPGMMKNIILTKRKIIFVL